MEECERGASPIYQKSKKPMYAPLRRGYISFFFVLATLSLLLGGCGRKRQFDLSEQRTDSLLYTSITTDIVAFISDSGVTKYRVETDLWLTQEEPEELWTFPKGIYVEQFDTLFRAQATIVADTAYYHVSKGLWELKEHVHIVNREGTEFFARHLFWDEEQEIVYSRDSVRIVRGPGEELRSRYGFVSNQYMTKYELYDSAGHMDVTEEESGTPPADSLAMAGTVPDSIPVQTSEPGDTLKHSEAAQTEISERDSIGVRQ